MFPRLPSRPFAVPRRLIPARRALHSRAPARCEPAGSQGRDRWRRYRSHDAPPLIATKRIRPRPGQSWGPALKPPKATPAFVRYRARRLRGTPFAPLRIVRPDWRPRRLSPPVPRFPSPRRAPGWDRYASMSDRRPGKRRGRRREPIAPSALEQPRRFLPLCVERVRASFAFLLVPGRRRRGIGALHLRPRDASRVVIIPAGGLYRQRRLLI